MDKVFPFSRFPDPSLGGVPYGFRELFLKTKPPVLVWYAASVKINSPTSVEFTVMDMADPFHGGIGEEIRTLTARCDPSVTRADVVRRCTDLAADRRRKELNRAEDEIVATYANELLAALSQPATQQGEELDARAASMIEHGMSNINWRPEDLPKAATQPAPPPTLPRNER